MNSGPPLLVAHYSLSIPVYNAEFILLAKSLFYYDFTSKKIEGKIKVNRNASEPAGKLVNHESGSDTGCINRTA